MAGSGATCPEGSVIPPPPTRRFISTSADTQLKVREFDNTSPMQRSKSYTPEPAPLPPAPGDADALLEALPTNPANSASLAALLVRGDSVVSRITTAPRSPDSRATASSAASNDLKTTRSGKRYRRRPAPRPRRSSSFLVLALVVGIGIGIGLGKCSIPHRALSTVDSLLPGELEQPGGNHRDTEPQSSVAGNQVGDSDSDINRTDVLTSRSRRQRADRVNNDRQSGKRPRDR